MTKNPSNDAWINTSLGKIGHFTKGSGIGKDEVLPEGLCAIRYGELYTKHHIKVNVIGSCISEETAQGATEIHKGDIIFAGSGETIDEIGKSAVYLGDEKCYAGGDTIIFTPKDADPVFLAYLLNSETTRRKLWRLGQGQSVVHIYKRDLADLEVTLPPLDEQKHIVQILETWDRELTLLDEQISGEAQKAEAFARSLVLPTTGEAKSWKKLELEIVGKFRGGNGFPLKHQGNSTGQYPFFKVSDMNTPGNEVLMSSANHWIDEPVRAELRATIFAKDTIVMAKIGAAVYLERKRMLTQDSCIDNNMMGFTVDESVASPVFIYHLFKLLNFSRYATTTSLPSLSGTVLGSLPISLPPIDEQMGVVEILSAQDERIRLLKKKRGVVAEQRSYLLGSLVTGVLRTPHYEYQQHPKSEFRRGAAITAAVR